MYFKTPQGDSNSHYGEACLGVCGVLQFCSKTGLYPLPPPHLSCFPAHGHLPLLCLFSPCRMDRPGLARLIFKGSINVKLLVIHSVFVLVMVVNITIKSNQEISRACCETASRCLQTELKSCLGEVTYAICKDCSLQGEEMPVLNKKRRSRRNQRKKT